MLWPASVRAVTSQCHPQSVAAMLLLVPLLVQARHKRDAPPAAYRTDFSCVGRVAGYYADISSGCQLYHMCDLEGRRFTLACPNETRFQQRVMICDHWYMVRCNGSELDYSANQLIGQRDKPFVGPAVLPQYHKPVQVFTRQLNEVPVQRGSRFADVTDQSQKYSAYMRSSASAVGHLQDRVLEGQDISLDNMLAEPDPSTNRRARNRDVDASRSQLSVPQTSTSPSSEDLRTLPAAYTNNPFFHSLLSQRVPSEHEASNVDRLTESGTLAGHPDTFEDISDSKVSNARTLPLQSSADKTNDLSFHLRVVENIPTNFRQEKVLGPNINDQLLKSLTKANTGPLPTQIIPPSNEQASPQIDSKFNENESNSGSTIQPHLVDRRRMLFIPDSDSDVEEPTDPDLQASDLSAPEHLHSMQFRQGTAGPAGHNPDCPRCYPAFLVPGTCHPCVIIR